MDVLNIILGFIEGLALIISPCILPILPIILSGSLTGSKKRPIGIVIGFVIFFAVFTFFSRQLVQYSGIDLNLIRHISYAILFLLGVVMLSSFLTEKVMWFTQRLTSTGSSLSSVNNPEGGLVSGMLFGGLVAIIWTPCAGPILAAVIVQTVLQQTNWSSFLIVLSFGLGAAVPMLVIALLGRKIMARLSFFKTHAELCRKVLGLIVILSVVYMIYGEGVSFAKPVSTSGGGLSLEEGVLTPYPAPQIAGITEWINSPPLTMASLKGKVVLIDFWTYSCINCVRTLPYIKDWYSKYHNKGLVIIGVHTPEFEFEKNLANVKAAVVKDGIQYPVALDNQFATWTNFHNRYWPAHYLIDKNGYVQYQHFGEGDYDITENNIRYLLGIKEQISSKPIEAENFYAAMTPETYLGFARADHFASPESVSKNASAVYSYPAELKTDDWALQGDWRIEADKIVSGAPEAALKLHFNARQVFIVMGNTTDQPIKVKLLLNGEKVIAEKGKDVVDSTIVVNRDTIYQAVVLTKPGSGILQVIPSAAGLTIYTFTFGG